MDWELYSFVISSKRRKDILLSLDSELTPTEITKKVGKISIKNVSKLLGELREKGLVKCLTPDVKKGRVYALAPEGTEIVKRIKKA